MTKSADTPNADDTAALYERAWDTLIPARASYLNDVSAAPQRMAVYDRRVQHTLNTLRLTLTPHRDATAATSNSSTTS